MIFALQLVFSLTFPYFIQCQPKSTLDRRIINGNYAHDGQFPFFAEVINFQPEDRIVTCGGALISDRKVITVAHCLQNSLGILVRLGSTKKHQGKAFVVERQVKHGNMDFVVLILESSVKNVSENVKPVKIVQNPVQPREKCIAIGFGHDGKDYSEEMKFAQLHVNSINEVQKLVSFILSPNEIYAGMNDNTDVCFGDSGGPLLCPDGLAGITLGSLIKEPCNSPGLPSKFADLHKLRQWITSIRV